MIIKTLDEYESFIHTLTVNGLFNQIWLKSKTVNGITYITTNYRYYRDLTSQFKKITEYFTEEDNSYFPVRHTIHFVTDRVTMDSFRTHVSLSHLGESTRYCDYSKDKFKGQLSFTIPMWLSLPEGEITKVGNIWLNKDKEPLKCNGERDYMVYLNSLEASERAYKELKGTGWHAEEARQILPLNVKSELISCGFEDAWSNFLYRRLDEHAHPNARLLAKQVKEAIYGD